MRGKMVSIKGLEGKTKGFYRMMQPYLYDQNYLEAPGIARIQAAVWSGSILGALTVLQMWGFYL